MVMALHVWVDCKRFTRTTTTSISSGTFPADLANVWLELASIKYTNNFIDAELKNKKHIAIGGEPLPIMSDFGSPDGYGGKAPSGKYLSRLYLDHHKDIRPHLEAFIKRRPLGDSISLDVSYKAGRHIMRHKGKP